MLGLVDDDLISDHRYAEMLIRTRLRGLYGPRRVQAELKGKQVAASVIDECMPGDQNVWFDAAEQWAAKRHRGELDYATKAKLYRSLSNRGFTHEQVNAALDRLKSQD
jgi:regulatory protein